MYAIYIPGSQNRFLVPILYVSFVWFTESSSKFAEGCRAARISVLAQLPEIVPIELMQWLSCQLAYLLSFAGLGLIGQQVLTVLSPNWAARHLRRGMRGCIMCCFNL